MSPQFDQYGNPYPQNGMQSMAMGRRPDQYPDPRFGMPQDQPMMRPNPWDQQGWRNLTPSPQQVSPIRGKVVNSLNDITPQDVPMDGSPSFFPNADYTCVYMKVWDGNGTIKTFRFIPELEASSTPDPKALPMNGVINDLASSLNQRLDAFEKRMNDILGPFVEPTKKE